MYALVGFESFQDTMPRPVLPRTGGIQRSMQAVTSTLINMLPTLFGGLLAFPDSTANFPHVLAAFAV